MTAPLTVKVEARGFRRKADKLFMLLEINGIESLALVAEPGSRMNDGSTLSREAFDKLCAELAPPKHEPLARR